VEIIKFCKDIVAKCIEKGADEAEVFYSSSKNIRVVWEKNDLQVPKTDNYRGIGIRVLKDGAFGFASTNVLEEKEIDRSIEDAVTIASASPVDPANYLPEPDDIGYIAELVDDEYKNITLAEALEYGEKAVSMMLNYDQRVKIDSAHFGVTTTERAVVNSRGVEAKEGKTVFEGISMAFARDGERVSSFDAYIKNSCKLADLKLSEEAEELAHKVIDSLNADTVVSFNGSVILSPYAALNIIAGPILSSIDGDNVINGVSPWNEKIGERVVSDQLTIISRAFDREGVPTRKTAIITDGVLNSYLHNCYTARKMGVKPTGHAGGSDRDIGISPSNFMIKPGENSLSEIIEETGKGLLVNRFSGNVDAISGNFSGIVKGGVYIENGGEVKPIKEVMIAGNIYKLLKGISMISSETKNISIFTIPYIRLEGVSVTGK